MQMKYGTYTFNANDVAINHTRRSMRAETGYKTGYVDTWILDFRLRADTQAELTTEISSFFTAFSVDGYDLILLDNSGNNSAFITQSNSTTSGVRVGDINFPLLRGGQYTTFIDGTVQLEAETVTNSSLDLFYSDSFVVTGDGGPKEVILETARGLPIRQTTRQRTKVTAVQTGSARRVGAAPAVPIIMFPNLLIHESKVEGLTSSIEGGKIVYSRQWSYPYQNTDYFFGTPQVRT